MYVTGFCHKEPRCCVAVYLQICVCVCFLYTVVIKEMSACGITRVSKKGMDLSALVSSVVNWMYGSKLLVCSRNYSFFDVSVTTKVSSTYLFPYSWRILNCVDGLGLIVLHVAVGHYGADG